MCQNMFLCLSSKPRECDRCHTSQDIETVRNTEMIKVSGFQMGGSPYHTIPADMMADGWVLPMLKSARSTSLDNLRAEEMIVPSVPPKIPYVALYEYYKLAYAETLNRWGLLYHRAEVSLLEFLTYLWLVKKKATNHRLDWNRVGNEVCRHPTGTVQRSRIHSGLSKLSNANQTFGVRRVPKITVALYSVRFGRQGISQLLRHLRPWRTHRPFGHVVQRKTQLSAMRLSLFRRDRLHFRLLRLNLFSCDYFY